MSAVAEEGWGLTKRLREAERAYKCFAQVMTPTQALTYSYS